MKKAALALAALLLTGCGSSIPRAPVETVTTTTTAVTTAPQTTTTAPAATTIATTTTKKKEKKPEIKYTYADTVEIYQKLTIGDWIKDATVKPDNADDPLPTDTLGKNEVTVKFGDVKQKLSYTVADTTPPQFIYCPDYITVHKGSGFEPGVYIGYGDNYDKAPQVSYSGSIDTLTSGDYDVTFTVTDSSGNSTTKGATINVVDVLPDYESTIPEMSFEEFKQKYSSEGSDVGLDVSYWQGDIDFKKVKNAGCSFVFVRAAHHSDTIYPDENFLTNVDNATAAGLDVGVYFYSTCSSPEQAREQAQYVIDKLAGRQLALPIAFDWESFDRFQRFGMSIHDLNECCRAFCEVIEQNGYKAMLYSSKSFLENFWEPDDSREVWLANYTEQTDYKGSYTYWQQGLTHIDGIGGDVDADVRYLKG
ncbi:MAG: DUF5011 domain-containing protein [Ruminococcus sp.]|nr:DUF5011 domain-containing protein [Ruminococcus sp.]